MSEPTQSDKDRAETDAPARPIYLDYQATTPADPRVVEAMLPYFTEKFGNPHSVHHAYGWEAEAAVEEARAQLAGLIGAEPREIVFTSGATESNNLAIKGAARFHRAAKPHVISCVTEHKCVLEALKRIEGEGTRVTLLPVDSKGLIDLAALEAALGEDTALVSIMAANNEIGVIQPRHSAGRRDRRAVPRPRRLFPQRRGPGGGQDPDRRRRDEDRPAEHFRPQVLCSQGDRRALCPPAPAGAHHRPDGRRRPGAGLSLWHLVAGALRRPGRGRGHCRGGDG
jgi:hypothetical protein